MDARENRVHYGEFVEFQIDWRMGEMQLSNASPHFRRTLPRDQMPITPLVLALESLTQRERGWLSGEETFTFRVDVRYQRNSVFFNLHRSDQFGSVVDVPLARLTRLLRGELTPRETEIAILLFEGGTIRGAANQLHITEGTVKRIIYNIYQKFNVASQVELVREIYTRLAETQAQGDAE